MNIYGYECVFKTGEEGEMEMRMRMGRGRERDLENGECI